MASREGGNVGGDALVRSAHGGKPIEWTASMDALLGTLRDADVAILLGVGATTVHYRRVKLGVTAFASRFCWVDWTPDMDAMLGTMGDLAVAEKLGLAAMTVWRRRKQLGVPGVRGRDGREERV